MSISIEENIRLRCPPLDKSVDRDIYIEMAKESISVAFFGTQYNKAVALRASHDFTLTALRPDGEAGLITSKSDGRASVHYINMPGNGSNSELHMTVYGKQLLSLAKSRGPAASVGHPGIDPSAGIPASIYVGDDE